MNNFHLNPFIYQQYCLPGEDIWDQALGHGKSMI
jgi:hypothetical protein